jgi:2,5-dioxopentanoate dehydrogenase
MRAIARALKARPTATLQMDPADAPQARRLLPLSERKARRVLANGFPTGVLGVRGGPFPTCTNFGATGVSTLSIRRFLRPVCYQNLDPDLLPELS